MKSSAKPIAKSPLVFLKSLMVLCQFTNAFYDSAVFNRGLIYSRQKIGLLRHDKTAINLRQFPENSSIQHPVLRNLYEKMMQYKAEYGHPNIPLPEGKGLETLRRLHIQNKLLESEVKVLESIGFRFHSLEDVYDYADFDDMFQKLLLYRDQFGDVSPPKKYNYDPELGAWVTGIRRRGQDNIRDDHLERLNSIDFQWNSPRKCGSSFMQQYRTILEMKEKGVVNVLDDQAVRKWVAAMQKANLSETRHHYMTTLIGDGWIQMKL